MLSYKFRIYPSRKNLRRLGEQFDTSCRLYNILLSTCRDVYKTQKKSLTKYDLNKLINKLKKKHPEFKSVHSQVLRNCSDRLTKAYANFFRRAKERKAGKKVKLGFPRFKKHFKSITYPQSGFKIVNNRLILSKIGRVPIILHRDTKGKIKTLTIKRAQSGKWFAIFCCDIPKSKKRSHKKPIGIDVGLKNLATLSNGIVIENPKFLVNSEERLKHLQRLACRKVKGSNNRYKAFKKVAIQHEKIVNQRDDFLHKTSRHIVNNTPNVCVENLNIDGMLQNHYLAKHIQDASWGKLLRMVCYKAVSAGGSFIVGNPFEPTTQTCCGCGAYIKKSLSERMHNCPICGLKMDRDLNAAINVSRPGHGRIHACGDSASTSVSNGMQVESSKQELQQDPL